MLMDDNSVSVTNISKKLGVTVVTARSDLATLESEGFLVRTHGGAVPLSPSKTNETNGNQPRD